MKTNPMIFKKILFCFVAVFLSSVQVIAQEKDSKDPKGVISEKPASPPTTVDKQDVINAGIVKSKWTGALSTNPQASNPVAVGTKGKDYTTMTAYLESLPKTEDGTYPEAFRNAYPPVDAGKAGCGNISDLTFVGLKFIGYAACIPARADSEASAPCGSGWRAVNPANPQYGLGLSGDRSSNPAGYYYCVIDDIRNHKRYMCENLAKLKYPFLNFRWKPAATGGDGDCLCAYGTPSDSDMCNDADHVASDAVSRACQSQNPLVQAGPGMSGDDANCSTPSGGVTAVSLQSLSAARLYGDDKLYCRCNSNAPASAQAAFAQAPITDTSCGFTGTIEPAANTAAASQTVTTNNNQEFNGCLTEYHQKATTCQTQATQAKNTCDDKIKNAKSSPLNIAGSMVNAAGQVGIASNAGSGNQQKCFGAGVGMMGTRQALQMGQQDCESEFATCQRSCAQDVFDRMAVECPAKLRNANNQPLTEAQLIQAAQTSGDPNAQNAQTYQSAKNELQNTFQEGRQVCTHDAGGAKSDISNLMSGLGNAVKSSLVCACQLDSRATINCGQIPTIDTCETNPMTANCAVYSSVDTCNPSSAGYNQQQCNCLQNPTSCSTISGQPGPSMFGGNLAANLIPSGGGGVGGIGGGLAGGAGHYGVDAGGGGEAQAFLGRGSDASTGGGGGSGGVGAMGAGGGPGGSGNGPLVDGKSEEKGLAGLFNQAKNFVSKAFGKGDSSGNGKIAAGKGSSGKDDLTRFKPRGLASAGKNGIGTANMDIFGMIKLCATGETCISNQPPSAWILTP